MVMVMVIANIKNKFNSDGNDDDGWLWVVVGGCGWLWVVVDGGAANLHNNDLLTSFWWCRQFVQQRFVNLVWVVSPICTTTVC
jgi:hypothetical protein